MSYTYKDNTDEVLSALEKAKIRGLTAIGLTAEGHAKKKITQAKAVDTGRLRNSITFAVSGESANISSYSGDHGEEGGSYSGTAPNDKEKAVYIGTGVEYAIGIETGSHRKAGGVHFLQDAAQNHTEEYKRLMEDSMKNA
jgi:hypothetical protein